MSPLRGILLTVFGMAALALADTGIKLLIPSLHVTVTVACAAGMSAVLFGLVAIFRKERYFSPLFFEKTIFLRNVGELLGGVTFAFAIALSPLSIASAIQQVLPLTVTLCAALFLGEVVGWRRWLAMAIGFVGVILVIKPGTAEFDPYSLLAAASVIGFTLRDIMTARVPKSVSSLVLASYGFVMIGGASFILALVGGHFQVPPPNAWPILIGMTAFFFMGVLSVTTALRIAPVSVVIPFRYSRIVFAMIIGVVFLGEDLDFWTYFGSAVIVVAGLYSLWREAKLARG